MTAARNLNISTTTHTDDVLDLFSKPSVATVSSGSPRIHSFKQLMNSEAFQIRSFSHETALLIGNDESIEAIAIDIRVIQAYQDLEIVKSLRGERPLTPIVVFNSNNNFELKLLAYHSGATEVIVSETPMEELTVKFHALCSLGRAARLAEVQNHVLIQNMDALSNAESQSANTRDALVKSAKLASLGEMAGNIAHEIKNPLAVIEGRILALRKLLKEENPSLDDANKILDRMNVVTERINAITRGLKTFARAGDSDPFEVINISQLVQDTVSFSLEPFKMASVMISLEQFPESSLVQCRPTQISQILVNLLSNAKDAIEKLPKPWVKIKFEETETHVSILVCDSGPGVSPETESQIFKPFFTTKAQGKGTGLGLSISQEIAKSHRGSLTLDRSIGASCFKLELPKKQD